MKERLLALLKEHGIETDDLLADGVTHYVRVQGDKGRQKSGWYQCFYAKVPNGDEMYRCAYGNDQLSDGRKFEIVESPEMHPDDRRLAVQLIKDQRAEIDRQETEAAIARAQSIWNKLPEGGACKYLDRKRVRAFGVRFGRNMVAVPVRRVDNGVLVSVQFIQENGDKKFVKGTPQKGACHLIGDWESLPPGTRVVVLEGYATGGSVFMATGWPVAVAFSASNLEPVAVALKAKFPHLQFIVAGDNDVYTGGNPGLTAARAAAKAIGGLYVVPTFEEHHGQAG